MQQGNHAFNGSRSGTDWVNQMLYPVLEEKMRNARLALDRATSDNIIDFCRQYLALLAEYRGELYKLQGTPAINLARASSQPDINSVRKAVRVAIESTTRERNRFEALLRSFTAVSGYEAIETFNRRKYKGHDNWELRAGGAGRFSGCTAVDRMTVQEAVDIASLIRREEQIAQSAELADVNRTGHAGKSPLPPELLKASERSASS
jgi:hypothetical protein